jgi:hypothetical protein
MLPYRCLVPVVCPIGAARLRSPADLVSDHLVSQRRAVLVAQRGARGAVAHPVRVFTQAALGLTGQRVTEMPQVAGGPGNRDAASVTGPGLEILADTGRAAHNRAVHGRLAAGAFVLLLVSAVTACTSGAPSTQPRERATATASAGSPARAGQALGGSGYHPSSPVTLWQSFLPQVEGTGHGATLWGLLMFPHALPARVGDQEKIVWRMTGNGTLTLQAIDPDGKYHQLAWGPDAT